MVIFIPIIIINDYSFIFTFVALIVNMLTSHFARFPFYFELKIAFVVWLLSPYTKGSSVLYRKFVHPTLSNKEKVQMNLLHEYDQTIVRGGCFQTGFLSTPPIREFGQGNGFVLRDVCVCHRKLMST